MRCAVEIHLRCAASGGPLAAQREVPGAISPCSTPAAQRLAVGCLLCAAHVFPLALPRPRLRESAALRCTLPQQHSREFSAQIRSAAREIENRQERLHAHPTSLVVRRISFSRAGYETKEGESSASVALPRILEARKLRNTECWPALLTGWHSTAYDLAPKARFVEFFGSSLRWRARARARARRSGHARREKITRWSPTSAVPRTYHEHRILTSTHGKSPSAPLSTTQQDNRAHHVPRIKMARGKRKHARLHAHYLMNGRLKALLGLRKNAGKQSPSGKGGSSAGEPG